MGGYCCCESNESIKNERRSEMQTFGIMKPKEGRKYQLLCLRGHEIVFYKHVKENYETSFKNDGSSKKQRSSQHHPYQAKANS